MNRVNFILAILGLGKDMYPLLRPFLLKAVKDSENKVDDSVLTVLDFMLITKE